MSDLLTRVTFLEERQHELKESHRDLREEMAANTKELHERIDITEQLIREGQKSMNEGLGQVQNALTGVTAGALTSWPPDAVDALKEAAEKANLDALNRGRFLGAILSLLALVILLAVVIYNHIPV